MKAASKTQKASALFVGIVVSVLAIFAGEFSSHGETVDNSIYQLDIDETALIERAIQEMDEEEYVIEEAILKTIKIYDKDNELIEIISLWEDQEVEDEYTLRLLNQSNFLSSYNNTSIYQVAD
ncbi:MAG: hypothetical protein HEP71_25055 [Roseivirga sp.]|nr:hypothetical protein [Roseivirga sp.]